VTDAEAVERPGIAVNGVQEVAGGDVSAVMPETGPVAGGLEPLHQALDIQGIGKYHRLLPTDGAAQRLWTADVGLRIMTVSFPSFHFRYKTSSPP
jgi:hypothetical protein